MDKEDSGIAVWLEKMGLSDGLKVDWTSQIMRLRLSFVRASQAIETGIPDMAAVEDLQVRGGDGMLLARAYTPLAAGIAPGPGLVFFHGGGFVLGDIHSFDTICRRLADASRCRVLSVDYRLAPEHRFPAQVEDAISAFGWAVEQAECWGVDPTRLAVGGDSAGGNLSINITHAAKASMTQMPAFQLLIYPLTQFFDIKSKGLKLQEAPIISTAVFDFFRSIYLPEDADPMDPRISPLFVSDFSGLPAAHIITAGLDPLRDEGRAYAAKLAAAGVHVTERDYPVQPHGFFNTTPVSIPAREAVEEAGRVMGRHLGALAG